MSEQSAKPYLIRALCEWCADNGLTPYLAVKVNAQTRVPQAFVRNGEIVLNISANATRKLTIVTMLTPPEAYEGGNLLFLDKGEPMRPAQGSTVIFPPYMAHKVEPVTRGSRYTLVAWAHGPAFT